MRRGQFQLQSKRTEHFGPDVASYEHAERSESRCPRPSLYRLAALLAVLTLLQTLLIVPPSSAGHLQTGCYSAAWTEAVKENDIRNEDGVHGQIQVNYPDGGPVNNGGIVKSLFAWRNYDNFAEVGWLWRDGFESSQRRFTYLRDAGTPGAVNKHGYAGDRGTFHHHKLSNDYGDHWKFRSHGETVRNHTFVNLNSDILPWGNSEVDNSCDSAWAHFKDLTDKDCDDCRWEVWYDTQNSGIGTENPCYHTDLAGNNEFYVRHGSGSGETCQ